MRRYVQALNEFYNRTPALYEIDDGWDGFAWLNVNNAKQSAVSFLRRGERPEEVCVCAFNFTPVSVERFLIGLPSKGALREVFSSDEARFGGSGNGAAQVTQAVHKDFEGHPYRAAVDLPPLAAVYFELDSNKKGSE